MKLLKQLVTQHTTQCGYPLVLTSLQLVLNVEWTTSSKQQQVGIVRENVL